MSRWWSDAPAGIASGGAAALGIAAGGVAALGIASGDAAALGIAADGVAWHAPAVRHDGTGLARVDARGACDDALRQALAAVAHGPRGARVCVAVAADVAPHWMMQPAGGVRSVAELRALALSLCCELFGGRPDDWVLAGDWSARRAFACAALPRSLNDAILRACAQRGLRPRVQTSLGIVLHRCAHALPRDGWACIRTRRTLAVVDARRGRLASLRVLLQSEAGDGLAAAASAAAVLRREALRLHVEPPSEAAWLDCASGCGPLAEGEDAPCAQGIRFARVPIGATTRADPGHEAACALAMAVMAAKAPA